MTVEELISEKKETLWKLFLGLGILAVAPFAAWLFCVAIGGCKALFGGL